MVKFWLRGKEAGVIFLMGVDSDDDANRRLKTLPLGQADLISFEPIGDAIEMPW